MIFRFISSDDWQLLFKEEQEAIRDSRTFCSLSNVFLRHCEAESKNRFVRPVKMVGEQFKNFSNLKSDSKIANNGN